MTHVWIMDSPGVARFVDDIHLPPCNGCGERISKCNCGKEEPNNFCGSCNGDCRCDEKYDAMREENDAIEEAQENV